MSVLGGILLDFVHGYFPKFTGVLAAKLTADKLFELKYQMKLQSLLTSIDLDLVAFAESEGLDFTEIDRVAGILRDRLPEALRSISDSDWDAEAIKRVLSVEGIFTRESPLLDIRLKPVYETLFEQTVKTITTLAIRAKNIGTENISSILDVLNTLYVRISAIEAHVAKASAESVPDITYRRLRTVLARKAIFDAIDPFGVATFSRSEAEFKKYFVEPSIHSTGVKRTAGDFLRDILLVPRTNHVLYGGAGAGKTTLSKWFEKIGNSEFDKNMLVIGVSLRAMSDPAELNVQSLLLSRLGQNVLSNYDASLITRLTDHANFLFILDGFDEIHLDKRAEYTNAIEDFIKLASPCGVVITSRRLSTDHLSRLSNFRSEILSLDDAKIAEYIDQYSGSSQGAELRDFDKLKYIIVSNKRLKHIASNPLMLATITTLYNIEGAFPYDIQDLYRRFVNAMVSGWHDRKGIGEIHAEVPPGVQREILRKLALRMVNDDTDLVSRDYASQAANSTLITLGLDIPPEKALQLIHERTGLIEFDSEVEFLHKTLCEYLAAECIWEGNLRDSGVEYNSLWLMERLQASDKLNNVAIFWYKSVPYEHAILFSDSLFHDKFFSKWLIVALEDWARFDEIRFELFLSRLKDVVSQAVGGVTTTVPSELEEFGAVPNVDIGEFQLLTYSSVEECLGHIRAEREAAFLRVFDTDESHGVALKLMVRTSSIEDMCRIVPKIIASQNPHIWLEFGRRWSVELSQPIEFLGRPIYTFLFMVGLKGIVQKIKSLDFASVFAWGQLKTLSSNQILEALDIGTCEWFVSGKQYKNLFATLFDDFESRKYNYWKNEVALISAMREAMPEAFFIICWRLCELKPAAVLPARYEAILKKILRK